MEGTRQPLVTSNLRVSKWDTLPSPRTVLAELPLSESQAAVVEQGRRDVRAVMAGADQRLLVIVGPCSIHDPIAALDYAERLAAQSQRHRAELLVVMRTYFEKPRTTVGWKGLINDPHLDGSHDIAAGLRIARHFLRDVASIGLPCGTEFLEPISPQYFADLISWGAIGARTTESQIHRQLASGLSMPIGFKNGTDGEVEVALDGCAASAAAQSFLGIDENGHASLVTTVGNPDTHIILRGGTRGPNYAAEHVESARLRAIERDLNAFLIVDASHANSGKDHLRQATVASEIGAAIGSGRAEVGGIMLESFIVEGAQQLEIGSTRPADLAYGQSVTDACLGWDATVEVLETLATIVKDRNSGKPRPSV